MADAVPYLIPRIVYVGDRAKLVVPLSGFPPVAGTPGAVPALSGAGDVVVHRAELEQWGGELTLVVDFTAYATGVLELPPVELNGLLYRGLTVEIASILGDSLGGGRDNSLGGAGGGMTLSGPAPPLAVPGTSFFVYGVLAGIVMVFLALLGGRFWVRRHLKDLLLRWKRRRLIASMGRIERRLRISLEGLRTPDSLRERLDYLSGEFRTFLELFTLRHCQSMTAEEMEAIPALAAPEYPGAPVLGGSYLGPFFRRCDDLRYGGGGISAEDLRDILGKLRLFLNTLDRAERAGAGS
ncbi:MAG: hypothetical protein LBQ55_04415 [Treponema sp.]|jgi:hypothetical protein|nr:hypothetical protein [Treponema sp.]